MFASSRISFQLRFNSRQFESIMSRKCAKMHENRKQSANNSNNSSSNTHCIALPMQCICFKVWHVLFALSLNRALHKQCCAMHTYVSVQCPCNALYYYMLMTLLLCVYLCSIHQCTDTMVYLQVCHCLFVVL